MRITGKQFQRITIALRAFNKEQFTLLLCEHLDENLEDISLGNDMHQVRFNVVQWADNHGRIGHLLIAAASERQDDDELKALAEELAAY